MEVISTQPLRDAVHRALRLLPIGVYYRQRDFLAHAVFGPDNPLLLGRAPGEVSIIRGERLLPPLDEALEPAGRELLGDVLRERLIPLVSEYLSAIERDANRIVVDWQLDY